MKPSRWPERVVLLSLTFVRADTIDEIDASLAAAEFVELHNAGEFEALHGRLSPPLAVSRSPGTFRGYFDRWGPLRIETIAEAYKSHATLVLVAERDQRLELELEIDENGRVDEFTLQELGPFPRTAPMRLPFRGEWWVYTGGCDPLRNPHSSFADSRCAADLMIKDTITERTYRGEGRHNADYFAYGQDIRAMAGGTVTIVVDGVPDNLPHEMNRAFPPGNMVMVRHDDGQHSVYAHLIPGTAAVEPGERVVQGQLLGKCGNSGNSSQPHLHVQVQDGPDRDRSWGVEAVFGEVEVLRSHMRTRMSDYFFVRGDWISQVEPSDG